MFRNIIKASTLLTGLLLLSLKAGSQTTDTINDNIKGKVSLNLFYCSHITNDTIKYSVYLPPSYATTKDSFPVYFLLHGLGGDENSWIKDLFVHRTTDSLIVAGAIHPLIIIMPDGKRSYYINDFRNALPYENIFINEFIPYIDSLYKVKAQKHYRAIGGLSMGGYGALVNGFRHPDIFSAVVALSAAVRTDSMIFQEKPDRYAQIFKPLFGDSILQYKIITRHWKDYNPLYLADKKPEQLRTVHWYIDCGFSDYLLPGNEALHDLLLQYKVQHEYHVRPGTHERAYWSFALVPTLFFLEKVFDTKP
jgi:enterochelin esterase-like enzyme